MSTIKELCYACMYGRDQDVQTILSRGDLDINTKYGYGYGDSTPLHIAMANNHPSIVRMLLARADTRLDVTDNTGSTGLHDACYNNNPECVSLYGEDRRCSAQLLNLKDNDGNTPVMLAVERGHLECVREMEKLAGVDFETRNSQGETMIEVARRCNYHQIIQFLQMSDAQGGRNVPHAAAVVASSTLREIAEELASIEGATAVLVSDKEILNERHKEELARHKEEKKSALENFHRLQNEESETVSLRQRSELEGIERNMLQNKTRQDNQKRRLQEYLNSSASSALCTPNIPECPICFEEMRPHLQIFNCRNGHLVCSVCKPRVSVCMCREEYMGRATAVEQIIRQMVGLQ